MFQISERPRSFKGGEPVSNTPTLSYRETPTWALTSFWLLEVAIWGAWCLHFDMLATILAPWEHPGVPFWHLGTTLGDHESSRMDTKWSGARFSSILR